MTLKVHHIFNENIKFTTVEMDWKSNIPAWMIYVNPVLRTGIFLLLKKGIAEHGRGTVAQEF